jgi:hypothetical protein
MMKYSLWLLLLVLLLSACGGKATPTLPSAQQAETALAGIPLPQSEETLLAELPPQETGIPTEAPPPAPLVTTDAMQAPIYTDLASSEVVVPSFTPPPLATAYLPTPGLAADDSQVMIPLIISGSLGQAQEAPAPLAMESVPPNEVIIESRVAPTSLRSLGRLIPPGLVCLIGLILLGLGLYMSTTSQPTNQEITAVLNIADLQPGQGLVELKGVITQVARPLDKNVDNPLAVLRLVIEENEPQSGWRVVLDRVLATEFSLEDGTGKVWVSPDQLDLNLLGEGSFASIKQAEEALKILGLQASSAWGRGLRYRIWELRKGQPLIALGSVQQQLKLVGSSQHPVALSTATESAPNPAAEASGGHGINTLLLLVIALGGAAFLGGLVWLLWALMR